MEKENISLVRKIKTGENTKRQSESPFKGGGGLRQDVVINAAFTANVTGKGL